MSNYILPSYEQFLGRSDLTLDRLKRLLEFDSSWVNHVNCRQESPLFLVLKNTKCTADMVRLFLQYNSNIDHWNTKGDNCLLFALRSQKDEAIINVLLENGANVNIRDGQRRTALCLHFVIGPSKSIAKLLLHANFPINACMIHESLMHCAMDCRFLLTEDFLEMLIAAGGDLNSNENGCSPLCLVLQNGVADAQYIELLLSKGASLNACKKHDSSMLCATHNIMFYPCLDTGVVQLLLKKKVAMNKRSSGGTPLQWALFTTVYDYKAIKLMVNHSSFDVNALFENHENLLHLAVKNPFCQLRVLQLLIDKGVRVDEKNKDGQTLMEVAVMKGCYYHILKLLFVACSSIKLISISSLQFAFDEYKSEPCQKNLDRFKLLLKCSCLENRDFQFQDLRLDHIEHSQLLRFAGGCREELQRMELQNLVHNHTLRDFASEPCYPQNFASDCNSTISYDLNQLLRILSSNFFFIYFEIIVAKTGRISMKDKLEEVSVYTIQHHSASPCRQKCIVLDCDSLHQIAQYLADEDLMQLIIAFFIHQSD